MSGVDWRAAFAKSGFWGVYPDTRQDPNIREILKNN